MTTTIDVSPKQDFWHRLCRTRPLRAVSEMVWNAMDADAENVSVEFKLNPLGGLHEIIVIDDGAGIPAINGEEHRFAALGGSWKAKVQRTSDKRLMHGKFGEGRFRAFALGGMVTWVSRKPIGKCLLHPCYSRIELQPQATHSVSARSNAWGSIMAIAMTEFCISK